MRGSAYGRTILINPGSGTATLLADPDLFPHGGGRMGALMRDFDWAPTSIGPIAQWPQSLRTAVDILLQSPVPIVLLWGPDGIMIYNDAYSVFAGGRHPQLLGSPVLLGWPEVADFNRRVMEVGLAGGTLSFQDQHMVLNRTGTPENVWLDLDYSTVRDESGAPAGVLAIVSETTRQVVSSRELREREAELARVQRIGRIGGLAVDLDGGFHNRRSPEYLLVHGLPPESANESHDSWVQRVHPDDRVATVQHFLDAIAGDVREYTSEYRIVRPNDGQTRWIAVNAEIERDAQGRAIRLVGAHTDVTERKAAAAALATLNATLEQQVAERTRERDRIWSVSHDLLLVIDETGKFLSVNPAWSATLGWTREELLGQTSEWLEHPDDRERTRNEVAQLASGRATLRFENRMRCKNGTYRWFSWTAVPDAGFIYAVGRDVTQERQAEQALRTAEDQLRQSQKMEAVGQLTGGIAHDFNNLLTGIIGGLDIIKRRIGAGRTNELDRFINAAVASANRAAGLTHRLLAFSRRQALDLKPIDVSILIHSLADLLRRSLGERIAINMDTPRGLWIVQGDANQIETALLNLAINARDAMPDGGRLTVSAANISIDADVAPMTIDPIPPGDYVVMRVSDTGVGMAADVLERAFEPFFTTKPIGQGTGLGLSMVYGYAKQSRGHVEIDSVPGRGTTIAVYFPRYLGDAVAAEPGGAAGVDAPVTGETVLIVEDDPAVRMMVVEVLRDLGYNTIEASDDRGAIPLLESSKRIDLLVTDVGLPGLNGRQIADHARLYRPGLKVLFITGYAEDAAFRDNLLDSGMEIIAKPFSIDTLSARLQAMIRSS